MFRYLKINIFIFSLLFLSIFSFNFYANAQSAQEIINGVQNNIQISLSPQYPKAGDMVNVHLESYSTSLNAAKISWMIGGIVQKSGFGLVDFSTKAGLVGSVTKVTAQIVTSNGSTVEKTITIQPVDIDILWQATSYVPPFYQGKALYPHQGLITLTAVPNVSANGNIAKSIGSYIYTWKKDGDVLGDFSGYGKDTFTLRGTIISRPFTIEVDVSSTDGASLGSASVLVNPQVTQVAFYEKNPLLGVLYNKKLSNFTMTGKELTISAAPFYFNTGSEPANLQYLWSMNGNSITSQNDPSLITVRNTSGVSGSATIGLQVSNLLKSLQFSSNSMTVTFGKSNQSSI